MILSKAIDHEVTLWPLLPADALDHYRRGQPDKTDMEAELRTVFARNPDEPLPDLSIFAPDASKVQAALLERGVRTDARGTILRFGPAPYHPDAQLVESMTTLGEVCA